jgi:hypothetical protein
MGKLKSILLIAAVAALAACSGNDGTLVNPGGGGGTGTVDVATLTLLTSNPQILSDGVVPATITALVRDASNNVLADVPVLFSASTGSLVLSQPITTDATGTVAASLSTGGDPTNRTITVTATAGDNVQASVDVAIVGTTLAINGATNLPVGATDSPFNVVLTDAAGDGIAGEQVTVASANNNGISQTLLVTDSTGQASFLFDANVGGTDALTATALDLQATHTVDVSNDVFAFTTPPAGTQVELNANQSVTVHWEDANGDVVGDTVTFTTTRGTMNPADGAATTDANGDATITVAATNAGPAVLTATNALGTSTTRSIQFIATIPDTLELQANPFTVPTNDQSTITAIVRDLAGNLVTGRTVSFGLTDVTGGSLSVAQAVTDVQGRAQTVYTASSTTSNVDGVQIDASVVDFPAVTDSVNLTVAQRELFISIGTGNELEEPNTAQYKQEWIVQVTDANGNGVDQVDLTVSVLSERYWEGSRAFVDPPGAWVTRLGTEALPALGCPDEDINNRNGILDAGEDLNGSGRIEAGNIASAVAQDGGGNTITTDVNGFALVDLFYPQDHGLWVEVTLEARTSVQGSEFAESQTFRLPILAADVAQETTAPPGPDSPFGADGDCGTPPPGLP